MDERFRDRMRRERTDVILRETAGLASEQGWVTLRVEDVARRAGIAKGTIYLDFKDKDELITAAIRRSTIGRSTISPRPAAILGLEITGAPRRGVRARAVHYPRSTTAHFLSGAPRAPAARVLVERRLVESSWSPAAAR